MLESNFQARLKKKIYDLFPGCMILKNDTLTIQGFPDLLILYNDRWACLECKRSRLAKTQPNQDFYIDCLNEMSFGRIIYPENEEEVLYELQQAFES